MDEIEVNWAKIRNIRWVLELLLAVFLRSLMIQTLMNGLAKSTYHMPTFLVAVYGFFGALNSEESFCGIQTLVS